MKAGHFRIQIPLMIPGVIALSFLGPEPVHCRMDPPSPPPVSGWTRDLGGPMAGRPAAGGAAVGAATRDGRLVVLAADDGRFLWRAEVEERVTAGPVIHGGLIFLGAENGNLYAWDLATGAPRWGIRFDSPLTVPPGLTVAPPRLWIATADALTRVAPETGTILERSAFPGPPAFAPIGCGNRILVGTADGRLVGMDAGGVRPAWEVSCGPGPPGVPSCDGNAALFGCGDSLARIGLRKGKPAWKFRTGGKVKARPVVIGRRIFAGSYDNDLYILKRKSGHLVGTRTASHRLGLDPLLLSGNRLLVLPYTAGALQVFGLPDLLPEGTIAIPRPGEGDCSAPVAAGTALAILGCGAADTRLIALPVGSLPDSPEKADLPSPPDLPADGSPPPS